MSNQYFDDQQEYQYSNPVVFPDGSEISVYSTPDNRRMIIRHSSGSHIEFKNDGTVVVKAVKDLHLNSSVNSSTRGDGNDQASQTNIKCESDLNLSVTGKLSISCKELDIVAKDTGKVITSGDFITDANNVINKAKEQISMEGTKSVYVSTGELRENVVTRTSEIGTPTGGNMGGQSTMKVMGHFVLENMDPKGGITIKSAGYTNILTAAERIDLTGIPGVAAPVFDPTALGLGTYTHTIGTYPGPTPRGIPGSAFITCATGLFQNIGGAMETTVGLGRITTIGLKDTINVGGIRKVSSGGSMLLNSATLISLTAPIIFIN